MRLLKQCLGRSLLSAAIIFMATGNAFAKDLQNMTIEEKVGQLFFVRAEALQQQYAGKDIEWAKQGVTRVSLDIHKTLQKYPVGGVVIFGKNIVKPEQTKRLIRDLRKASPEPLFIAVDEEGGRVARLGNTPALQVPYVGNACRVNSSLRAYVNGHRIGKYLREYDIDINFAPVADVLLNKDNQLMATRSFGAEPQQCGSFSRAYINGLHDYAIMSTVKHFPGLGGNEADSHLGLSQSNLSLADLESTEFISFKQALAASDAVMVAHLSLPKVSGELPASLSKTIITDLLKNKLGYKGLVFTDSLAMGAIVNYYGPVEAPIKALEAGADVLLMPQNLAKAYTGVLKAVKDGRIAQERLDEAVGKILAYKKKYGRLKS